MIDVYPVGWLAALRFAWRAARSGRAAPAYRRLRQQWRYTRRCIRLRKWRAVRNSLNGYLAEHELGRRCGHGWTRRRAVRDLRRHLAALGLHA